MKSEVDIQAIIFDLGGVILRIKDSPIGPKGDLNVSKETWHKAGLLMENADQLEQKFYHLDLIS